MLKAGIQGMWWTNWNPFSSGMNRCGPKSIRTASTTGGKLTATAIQRIRPWARDGNARTTAIPTSGMKIIKLKVSVIPVPSPCSRRRGPGPVEEHAAEHADDDDVEIGRDRARLEVAHAPADELGHGRDQVDEPVDDVEVEEAGHPRRAAHDRRREIHEAVDHVEIEPGRRATEEQRAAHEDEVVELVDVVLVQDDAVGRAAERVAERLGPDGPRSEEHTSELQSL